MLDQLLQQFTQSRQGQTATSRLQSQGFTPQQSQGFLGAAVPTAAQAFHQAQTGGFLANRPGGPQGLLDVGNSHYVTNFLSGAVSGLIRGEGIGGAAVDGLQSVAGGHVAQVIASRFGLPQRVAGTIGAIVTPLVIDFLWERMNGGSGFDLGALFGGAGATQGAGGWGGGGGQPPSQGGWGGGGGQPPSQGGWGGGPSQPPSQGGWGGGAGQAPSQGGWGAVANGLMGGGGGPVSPTVQGGIGNLFGQLFRS